MTYFNYEKELFLSILSEKCQLYDHMYENIQYMISNINTNLNKTQQILISNTFNYKIQFLRNSLLTLTSIEINEMQKTSPSKEYISFIKEYQNILIKKLDVICNNILNIIDSKLLPNATDVESRVFYNKMKGDYLRYVLENLKDEAKFKKISEQAYSAYSTAKKEGKELDWKNEVKIEAMLNMSIFYYDILGNAKQGILLGKETLTNVTNELKGIKKEDEKYKGVFKIVNNIEENLRMWEIEIEEIGKK